MELNPERAPVAVSMFDDLRAVFETKYQTASMDDAMLAALMLTCGMARRRQIHRRELVDWMGQIWQNWPHGDVDLSKVNLNAPAK